ncbi:MAG: hypothetical protein PGN30_14200 [Mycolicibacterium neoaurum]|uniref:hypothetical protein n=1 Tax=Mycolicibacterium neoaurum TaxID=1795 RepID=UPI002FFD51D1
MSTRVAAVPRLRSAHHPGRQRQGHPLTHVVVSREHPAFVDLRAQRVAFARLVAVL